MFSVAVSQLVLAIWALRNGLHCQYGLFKVSQREESSTLLTVFQTVIKFCIYSDNGCARLTS